MSGTELDPARRAELVRRAGLAELTVIARATRAAILRRYSADSCIATTRALIEVGRYFAVPMRPWAVDLTVMNAEAHEHAMRGETDWPDSAWSVGMRAEPGARASDGGQFGVGHVVAIARLGTLGEALIDGSIDQTARPPRIPRLAPIIGELPDDFDETDRSDGGWIKHEAAGGLVLYYRASGSRLYATSANWRRSEPVMRETVAEAIREVRDTGVIGITSAARRVNG